MKLPRSILHGYDRYTEKILAQALGIPLPKKRKGGHHRMKIPVAALKKDVADKKSKGKKKSPSMKFGAMKGKKNDNDGDEY